MSISIFSGEEKENDFKILFNKGTYNQDLGLFSFPFDSQGGIQGRGNLTYWLDEEGKPYLKLFVWGSGGVAFVKKVRLHRKVDSLDI